MAFENVQFEHGNMAISIDGTEFYTIDHVNGKLISKTSSGSLIFSNFLDTSVTEVVSLNYDGAYFWSLERSGNVGFRVRKWLIGSDGLVRVQEEFSFSSDAINNFDCYTMAVEFYSDSLDGPVPTGTSTFDVNDGSEIRVGDRITIGPSTAGGFSGETFETDVVGKSGTTVTISPATTVGFNSGNDLFFTRNFFVFSDSSQGNAQVGGLYKFDTNGNLVSVDSSNLYKFVRASTFFQNYVMFVRGGEVIWLNPDTQAIFKSQAIDNLDETRSTHRTTYDLAGFSNTLYRLEKERVTFDSGDDTYDTEVWADYNFNTSSTVPEVYFVAVKAEPPVIHRSVTGLTPESRITVQVLDQFRTPVFNQSVSLSSTKGSLSPISGTTDADGIVTSTYTASTDIGEVVIEADVS